MLYINVIFGTLITTSSIINVDRIKVRSLESKIFFTVMHTDKILLHGKGVICVYMAEIKLIL